MKKGSKLYVEGRIQTRNWEDKDHPGVKHYRTEIVVNDLSLLSGRDDSGSPYTRSSSSGSASNAAVNEDQRPPAGQDDFAQSAEISDDDIPF